MAEAKALLREVPDDPSAIGSAQQPAVAQTAALAKDGKEDALSKLAQAIEVERISLSAEKELRVMEEQRDLALKENSDAIDADNRMASEIKAAIASKKYDLLVNSYKGRDIEIFKVFPLNTAERIDLRKAIDIYEETRSDEQLGRIGVRILEDRKKKILDDLNARLGAKKTLQKYFNTQIYEMSNSVASIAKARDDYYSGSQVAPAYQNLPALSTIYGYIKSGRCYSLEGPDGAYNLYESEMRLNVIVTGVQDIQSSLGQISENQFMLRDQINMINSEIGQVEREVRNTCRAINGVQGSIRRGFNAASEETRALQRAAERSAYWSERVAEIEAAPRCGIIF